MGADSIMMKGWNKSSVRRQLFIKKTATKQELSAATGLSVVTVNALLGEMLKEGEAIQGELVPSGGGRPSMQYSYNENFSLAVIIYGYKEQGRNKIHMLVVNLYGECLERKAAVMEEVELHSFEKDLDYFLAAYPAIRLIAFGMPGVEENGRIIINDYPELIGEALCETYQKRYKRPVLFENDVNAAIKGWYEKYGGEGGGNAAGIYFPKSDAPGAGVILSGKVHRGLGSFAGELGHIDFDCDWTKLDYENGRQTGTLIGRLAVLYSCILAPESIVLYGDFWKREIREEALFYIEKAIPESIKIEIIFADSFTEDFERGMIGISLEKMEELR